MKTKVWIYIRKLEDAKKFLLKADKLIWIKNEEEFDFNNQWEVIIPLNDPEATIQDVVICDEDENNVSNFLDTFDEELGRHALIRCELDIKD